MQDDKKHGKCKHTVFKIDEYKQQYRQLIIISWDFYAVKYKFRKWAFEDIQRIFDLWYKQLSSLKLWEKKICYNYSQMELLYTPKLNEYSQTKQSCNKFCLHEGDNVPFMFKQLREGVVIIVWNWNINDVCMKYSCPNVAFLVKPSVKKRSISTNHRSMLSSHSVAFGNSAVQCRRILHSCLMVWSVEELNRNLNCLLKNGKIIKNHYIPNSLE